MGGGYRMKIERQNRAISHADLVRRFSYDPDGGSFTYRDSGIVAGWDDHGYRRVSIDGIKYYVHRLIWFYQTGEWTDLVDHADRNSLNNRWNNLRPATDSQSIANRGMNRTNIVGFRGVRLKSDHGRRKPYEARIMIDGKAKHLGYFHTAEQAHEAYVKEATRLFGPYACAG
jgi:hypothetical protein